MGKDTDTYFEQLASRQDQPLLHRAAGTMLFKIEQGDGSQHIWRVAIDRGKIDVRRSADDDLGADCVISGIEDEFRGIFTGRDTFSAAYVRGAITVTGDHTIAQNLRRFSPPVQLDTLPKRDQQRDQQSGKEGDKRGNGRVPRRHHHNGN